MHHDKDEKYYGGSYETEIPGAMYLYKAWVVAANMSVTEVEPYMARGEVAAKVKAITATNSDPDQVHVLVHCIGMVPDWLGSE